MAEDPLLRNFRERLSDLIVRGGQLAQIQTHRPQPYRTNQPAPPAPPPYPADQFFEWRAQSVHLLKSFLGPEDHHLKEFEEVTTRTSGSPYEQLAKMGLGVLRATHSDVAWDGFSGIRSTINAETFSDMLDAAGYQLSINNLLPAAVMAGAVLEQHLRNLTLKHGLPIEQARGERMVPMAMSDLNNTLGKGGRVYNQSTKNEIEQITNVRNAAAHSALEERGFERRHVERMIEDVRRILSQFPA